jgi:putative peptidoglycan lipid II flippase
VKPLLRSTLVVSFFTVFNGAFNYLTLVILASRFGAGREMDAFFAATTIPQLITAILMATLTLAFIPVFIEARTRDEANAWKVASVLANVIFLGLAILAAAGQVFALGLVALTNPGFGGATLGLATSLFRYLIVAAAFSATSLVLAGLHYSRQEFLRPSLAQGLNSLVTFLSVVFLGRGLGIRSVAVGTLAGSVLQFAFLLPVLLARGRYSPSLDLRMKEVRRFAAVMLPLLAGSVFYKANAVVERFIASRLGESRVAYLGYAFKIVSVLQLVMAQGLSTTILPRMSEQSAAGDTGALRETVNKGIRATLVVTVPVLAGLLLGAVQVVRAVFERGDFTRPTTESVAMALVAYLGYLAVGVVAAPVLNAFYALQKTVLVATIGVAGFAFYVALAFLLVGPLSYPGIALAISIQSVLSLAVMIIVQQGKIGIFAWRPILVCLAKSTAGSGLAVAAVVAARALLGSRLAYPYDLLVLAALGVAVYGLSLILLRTEELRYFNLAGLLRRDRREENIR